jgi:GNAT superfamily N-acetyltransferase
MTMTAKHNDILFSLINEEDISSDIDRSIRETLVVCFPADREYYQSQSWWHCTPLYRVLGRNKKGLVVAHAAMVGRSVVVGPALFKVRVAGVQSFCVLLAYRGTGLSHRMMSIAMQEAQRRDFDAGLLFCQRQLQTVYGRMGWSQLNAAVYMLDSEKNKTLIPAKNISMFYPLRTKQLPPGDVDLAGTDW